VGMMRGPMHQGMPMQQQMPQQDAQDQQPAPGQMTQHPMMHGPMMYGPAMHHGYMGPMGGPMMGGMCPMGGPDFADGRLAFIKAELGITDQQQAAFDGFAKILKSHAEGRQERHEAMLQAMSQVQSPLDRLGARITMMEMRVGMMKEMKAALDKLYGTLSEEQKRKVPPVPHPVVRRHPETDRPALFLGDHAETIEGMDYQEGRDLIEHLMATSIADDMIYSHKWQPRECAIWDNRCTLHRATGFDTAKHIRVMRRCTTLGQLPSAA